MSKLIKLNGKYAILNFPDIDDYSTIKRITTRKDNKLGEKNIIFYKNKFLKKR